MYDALDGIKVIEVSMFAFVPSAGAVLSDWGANVVRVVHPDYMDPLTNNKSIAGLPDIDIGVSFMWEILNRGKRSVGIDLATPEGHEVLMRLVEDADVFLTNFRTKARKKLKIDIDDIRAVNPKIIYSRGTGHGPRGPQADNAGFDHSSFWARSGMAHAASQVTGDFIQQIGPAYGDVASGFTLASGTVTALFKRERTGEPSVVDVSLLSTGMWQFGPAIVAGGLYDVPTVPRLPHLELPNPLVAAYTTSDNRQIYMCGIQTDRGWDELCEHIGRPDLADDPRFAEGANRLRNSRECIELLDEIFATRPLAEWVEAFENFESCAWTVVQTAQELHQDSMAVANDFLPEIKHPNGTVYTLVASPVQFDERGTDLRAAPTHGEHTDEVLLEAGYTEDDLLRMKVASAIL